MLLLTHRSFEANAPPTCAYLRGTSAEVLTLFILNSLYRSFVQQSLIE